MEWLERFLDWTATQSCRVCGDSLGRARVVLDRGADGVWRADLRCARCRSFNPVDVPAAA